MKPRISLWDNLRFLLITLVVVGHFSDFFTAQCHGYQSLFLIMYPFHMPLFLFISGHFFRPEKIASKCLFYISVGFLLKLVIYAVTVFTGSHTSFSLLSDGGIPWYLFVLAIHTFLTWLLRNQNRCFILIISIVIACAAGFDPNIGDMLYLSRTIVFFPFYWAGTMLSDDTIIKIKKKPWAVAVAAAVFIAWVCLSIFATEDIYILRHLLTGRNPYDQKIIAYGPLFRLLTYFISYAVSFSVILLMPGREIPWLSKMGTRTIDVYFWHWPVFVLLSRFLHIKDLFYTGVWGQIAYLLIAVILTILLSQGSFISWPLNMIKKQCFPDK